MSARVDRATSTLWKSDRLRRTSAFGGIVLQKSFCGMGLKFSEAWARRLNNDVGDHVATGQTHRRFWQRVCGSIERRLSLVSFFGENLAAAAFGTFATLSGEERKCHGLSPTSPKPQQQPFSASHGEGAHRIASIHQA